MATSKEGFANFEKFEVNGKAVTKLKVDELKSELNARGLEKKGVKKELVERLCQALKKESTTPEVALEVNSSVEEKPTDRNDERSVKEVTSTTATKDSNDQDEVQTTEDKKDTTENSEENKDEKKSSETDASDNKSNDKETDELEDGEITGQDEEKKDHQKAVPEKRRRISLTRQASNNPPTPGSRKRKWSSNKPKSSVVISTDSLKELIPGVQLASTPALEAVMELEDDKEDEEMPEVKEEKQGEEKEQAAGKTNNKQDEKSAYKRRIVQVADAKTVKLGESAKEESDKEKNEVIVIDSPDDIPAGTGSHDDNQSSATPPSSETATPVKREISPPRNPPSRALHVANLVRPFTQKQLIEHLSQFGAVTEEDFWINKIKSHCYVIYQSVDEATNARQSLHGQRWPTTSPKFLRVDFADNDKMLEDTDGTLGKKIETTEQKKENAQEGKERSKERSIRKHKEKKEEKKKDEPSAAANLLDKLFRKTTTTPCIYWLPLTNEQIATREKEREERRKQRQLAIQQEQKQAVTPHQDGRKLQDVKKEKPRENVRGKEQETSRDQDRRPLRDNRVSSPPHRQRPDRRPSPVKRRSRSPAFRRAAADRRR